MASLRASARDRDFDEVSDEDLDGEVLEIEQAGSPTDGAAARDEPDDDAMARRLAALETGVTLGDPPEPDVLSKKDEWVQKKKHKKGKKKWKSHHKHNSLKQLSESNPSFASAPTFDMEEFDNPSSGKSAAEGGDALAVHDHSIDTVGHREKMKELKAKGNHADLGSMFDRPDIKHTFTKTHKNAVLCGARPHPARRRPV